MRHTDTVILGNGEFPKHPTPLAILKSARLVVACDGAITHYPTAEVVIGDGDSIPAAYRHKLIVVDEQDDNDLTKATRYCISQGCKSIDYVGCTGQREDHTIGNIALLMRYYRDWGIEGRLLTDFGWFTPCHGDVTFDSLPRQQVSIFNFGCSRLESEGLKWHSYAYREWWQGTLNEALADSFTLHADGYYMVYQTYACK